MLTNTKLSTNTQYVTIKAVERLHLLGKLRKCSASRDHLKSFYCATIIFEYGTQLWHGKLMPIRNMAPLKGLKKEYLVLFTMAWNIYIEALGVDKLKSL